MESHLNSHIFDARELYQNSLATTLATNPLYFDMSDWKEKKYDTKSNDLIENIRKLISEADVPAELGLFVLYNLKIEYASLVAVTSERKIKIAVPKGE